MGNRSQHGFRKDNEVLCHILNAAAPREPHGVVQLGPEQVQGPLHSLLTVVGQAPESRPSNKDHIGSEGQSLHHVSPMGDSAVEINLEEEKLLSLSGELFRCISCFVEVFAAPLSATRQSCG